MNNFFSDGNVNSINPKETKKLIFRKIIIYQYEEIKIKGP